jgi:Asp-tRNA(Asn)/Glu-tRNA(Gln) amidotransferase A subunit family amidase
VSQGPLTGEAWAGGVIDGAVTRTVRDAAGVLDVISKRMPGEPYYASALPRPLVQEVGADPGRLRILLPADDPAVDAGLREQHGQWRLAMDPGALAVGAPDMRQLLARCQAQVTLARGERDAMNTDEQLTRLGVPVVTLPGLGRNAHVESPHLAITLLDPYR